MRRSGEGEKGRYLPWSKEEEEAYIFWMKQVPVAKMSASQVRSKTVVFFSIFITYVLFSTVNNKWLIAMVPQLAWQDAIACCEKRQNLVCVFNLKKWLTYLLILKIFKLFGFQIFWSWAVEGYSRNTSLSLITTYLLWRFNIDKVWTFLFTLLKREILIWQT